MFPLRSGPEFTAVIADEYDQRVIAVRSARNGAEYVADRCVHLRDHGGETAAVEIGDVGVGLHGFLRRLQRRMWCGERQVHEIRRIAVVSLDQTDGLVPQQVGDVAFLVERFAVALPVGNAIECVGVVIDFAAVGAVEVVVATVKGMLVMVVVSQMPLAYQPGGISRSFQVLGQDPFSGWQPEVFPGRDRSDRPQSHRASAAVERRAGRSAGRVCVIAVEADSLGRELVKGRRPYLGSVVADIAPAQIVGHDQQDVGAFLARGRARGKAQYCGEGDMRLRSRAHAKALDGGTRCV